MGGLASLTRPELIFPGLPATDRDGILRDLAGRIAAGGVVQDAEALFQQLREREQLGSTGIGSGIAIPHCKLEALRQSVVAVATAREGVDFGAADGQPVKLFFLVLSPGGAPAEHLRVLALLSRWLKADRHAERLLELRDPQAIYRFLEEES